MFAKALKCDYYYCAFKILKIGLYAKRFYSEIVNHKKSLKSLLNPAQTESKNSFNEAYEMDDLEGLLKPQKRTRTTEGLAVLLTVKYKKFYQVSL